jgi:hypothetical protein
MHPTGTLPRLRLRRSDALGVMQPFTNGSLDAGPTALLDELGALA